MINNTSIFTGLIVNNSTITNFTFFAIPETHYMHFSDITNASDGITFYKACIVVYPHIFIPVIVLSFMIGYYIIKKVIKK